MDARAQHPAPDGAAGQPAALGDYQLSPRFARRAVADVYDAVHLPSGGARRVYVLRPGAMQNNPLVHRVVCEADSAHWLRHPAAARVEAHGDTPSRRLYVAVEQPAGRPLDAVIAEAGRLAPRRVVRLAGRVVEALEEAHALGLVHGRLTPAAVVVAPDRDAADAVGAPLVTLTGLGTAAVDGGEAVAPADRPYVSPEQFAGREPDARSDVYGLASLLHHALTGAAPAEASSDAPDASHPADADTGAVPQVIAAARAADPRRRPATVKAFWEDLLEALVADAVRATGAAPAPPAPARAAAPFDEQSALAHLELADVAAAPASESPAPALAPQAAPPSRPPLLEFRGIDVSATSSAPAAVRRPLQPRWAGSPAASAPAPRAPSSPAPTRDVGRPARRARSVLVHAWWLAVPAAAAALGWPLRRAADAAPAESPAVASAAWARVTAPPVLATVTARRRAGVGRHAAVGAPARRDADAAGVIDDAFDAPAAPAVDLPAVDVAAPAPATAPAPRVLVRPEEFTTRIKIPGMPQ